MPAFPIPALDLILNLADKNASGRLALSGSRVLAAPSSPSYRIVRADNGRVSLRACLPNLSGERAFDDVDLSVSTVRVALGVPGSNPFCLATLATPFPAAAAQVTTVQSATSTLPSTKRVTLDPAPYGGTWLLTLDALDPIELPFDADAAQISANTPALHYSIRKVAANAWEISGTEPNQDVTIALDVTGLLVPLGLTGDIALNTQGLADYFAAQASGTPPSQPKFVRLTLEVDIDGVKVYQNDRIEIARELINLSTLVPTPIPPSDYASLSALIAGKQPLSATLTSISSLLTTSWGRTLLTLADAGALRTYASLQPLSAQLTAIAALAGAAYGRGLLTQSTAAAVRAYIAAALDSATVHSTGDEAIAGIKSFSSPPVVPSDSFPQAAVQNLVSDLSTKAPLASPALTGTPTAPTPVNATSSTQLATTAFVHALITDLLNASPATLDTLKELADAIGDDPNFAVTVANSVAARLAKSANLSDLTDAPAARANLGLGNVNNTSDANKPVSTAQATADTAVANAAAAALTAAIANLLAAGNTFTGQNIFTFLQTFNAIASSSIAVSRIANPAAPTVTPIGNDEGATWSYKIVAKLSDGSPSAAGPAGTTIHGDRTLDATNRNSLSWPAVPGATSYDVYRTAVATSPSTTGKIANVSAPAYVDTGAAGDSSTPPATNATGGATVDGLFSAVRPARLGRRTIYASAYAVLDSNVLTGGGTDDTAALNSALDLLNSWGGGRLILDGAALISAPLAPGDNTTIECPNAACGVYLADGSNCEMLRNRLFALSGITVPPNRPGTYNKNIRIAGGTWNGNYDHQTSQLAGNIANFNTCGFFFCGVNNLTLDGVTILNPRVFAALLAYMGDPTVINCTAKQDTFHTGVSNDGFHYWGPITGVNTIRNVHGVNMGDDFIALSYAEAPGYTGDIHLFDVDPAGVNTIVDGVTCENCAGPVVIHGVTWNGYDSIITSVGNITIRNLSATFHDSGSDPSLLTAFALYADGRWDRLTCENWKIKYPPTVPRAGVDRNVKLLPYNPAAVMTFSNWQVSGAADDIYNFILFGGNSSHHSITLSDFHIAKNVGGAAAASLFGMSAGTDPTAPGIDLLTVRDCDISGFVGLIFNGRPAGKLVSVHLDNNTLNGAVIFSAGSQAPTSLTNGQFSLDYLTGKPISPLAMGLQANVRAGSVNLTAQWFELQSINFAELYAQLWRLNVSGAGNATQTRLSINAGNNLSGSFNAQADVISLFTGGGVIVGPSTVNPGAGVIKADVGFMPTLAADDTAQPNNTIYLSPGLGGLAYKDNSGVAHKIAFA